MASVVEEFIPRMPSMAKKAKKIPRKPMRQVRIRPRIAAQLDIICERDEVNFQDVVNRTLREFLAREHLWPPAGSSDASE